MIRYSVLVLVWWSYRISMCMCYRNKDSNNTYRIGNPKMVHCSLSVCWSLPPAWTTISFRIVSYRMVACRKFKNHVKIEHPLKLMYVCLCVSRLQYDIALSKFGMECNIYLCLDQNHKIKFSVYVLVFNWKWINNSFLIRFIFWCFSLMLDKRVDDVMLAREERNLNETI